MKGKFKAMVLAVAIALGIGAAADQAMVNSFPEPEFSVGPIPEAYKHNKAALDIYYATFAKEDFDTKAFKEDSYLFSLDRWIDCYDFKAGAHEAFLMMRDKKIWWDFRDESSLKAFIMDKGRDPAFKAFPYSIYRNDADMKAGALVAFMLVKDMQEGDKEDRKIFNQFMYGPRENNISIMEEVLYRECGEHKFRMKKILYHYVNKWVEERDKKAYWKER